MDIKTYTITPAVKKTSYEIEIYTNKLKDNTIVTIEFIILYRYGSFEIELNHIDFCKLVNNRDYISSMDYNLNATELIDGCDMNVFIQNRDCLNEKQMNELLELLKEDNYEGDNTEEDILSNLDTQILDNNGWYHEDTIYEIYNGFNIEENIEDVVEQIIE